MIPKVVPTVLLDEWVITTRYIEKEGFIIAHKKYPIPKDTLELITWDYLIKGMEGFEKGYSLEIKDIKNKETYKVTVERMHS